MKNQTDRKVNWTAEDRARHKAIREQFKDWRPTPEDLDASGDYDGPFPLGIFVEMRQVVCGLKHARQTLGLSLGDLAERSGIDKSSLSRLESGHQANPTLDTLCRYATALGKRILWVLDDVPEVGEKG
ncbi:MAG TPA: helix-turn-helix domain-containing protein [Pirellulales bacterium]|nr:helix-turn-helix domain-containing protein [Pirellulales bacterium]